MQRAYELCRFEQRCFNCAWLPIDDVRMQLEQPDAARTLTIALMCVPLQHSELADG